MSKADFADFDSVADALQECDVIKYAAYRTAAKLLLLQRALHLDAVPVRIIANVFNRHHLLQTENSVQLDEKELEPVLHDVYFVVKRDHRHELNINHAVRLATDYLLNVFDRKNKKSVQVLCSKIGLAVLCLSNPREKYQYLFHQLSDHNCCLSKKKLEILLKRMLSVTQFVGEDLYFRADLIPGSVESCFRRNTGPLGLSEDDFMSWLVQDPQILVWMSTFYRIHISRVGCHTARCAVCRIYPIVGLRYRCLRCLCYNQCQSCFFTGKSNKKHKLTHPVQEYCFEITSVQSTKAFLLTIKNRLLKTSSKLQYLPAEKASASCGGGGGGDVVLGESTRLLDEMSVSSRTLVNGSGISLAQKQPQEELRSIIAHLEKESEKIVPQIEKLCARSDLDGNECRSQLKKCLLHHKDQVEEQVRRLKSLKDHLLRPSPGSRFRYESTPVVEDGSKKSRENDGNDIEGLSPIARRKHVDQDRHVCLKKMMWDKYDMVNGTVNTSWEELRETAGCDTDVQGTSVGEGGSNGQTGLSTWLGGSELKEMDYSSNRGFSRWLDGESQGKCLPRSKECDGARLENEKYLDDIEYDLEDILNKLKRLTGSGDKEKPNKSKEEEEEEVEVVEDDVMSDIDVLLVGLINGIDNLVSH